MEMFGKIVAVQVYHELEWYEPDIEDNVCVKGSTLNLSLLDACIVTVVICLTKLETRRGHRHHQKLYAYTYSQLLKPDLNPLIYKFGQFLQWVSGEVEN